MSPPVEESAQTHSRISIAMILFGLIAVFMGLLNPGDGTAARPTGLTVDQIELVRADANAGFPLPPLPDNPPRGPGE